MLERNEVERALDWRKGLAARERKARWRGEDALVHTAAGVKLAAANAGRAACVVRDKSKLPAIKQLELF
jgi:hypothetical protein